MIPVATVLCESPDRKRWTYLDQVGTVSNLRWRKEYPGGDTVASCTLAAPPTYQHGAIVKGARTQIVRGVGSVWVGVVEQAPRTNDGWELTFTGIASQGGNEPLPRAGSMDQIVDALIGDGIPWSRTASIGGLNYSGDTGIGSNPVHQVLTESLLYSDRGWVVDRYGAISSVADATVPSLILRTPSPLNTTLNDWGSAVRIKYRTSASDQASSSSTVVKDADLAAVWGTKTHVVDAGDRVITQSVAEALARKYLNKIKPQALVTEDFVVSPGELMTSRGGRIDLASSAVIGRLAQIHAPVVLRDSMPVRSIDVRMLVGRTEYQADDGTLSVSPDQRRSDWAEIFFGRRGGGRIQ